MTPKQQNGAPVAPAKPKLFSRVRKLLRRAFWAGVSALALVTAVQIVLLTTPAAEALYRRLVVTSPPAKADLIVCLGGDDSRLVMAIELMDKDYAPKVAVSNAPGAAQRMKRVLVTAGVPAEKILVDSTSYITGDHPAGIDALGGVELDSRLLIITNHEHSRRVAACFRHYGFTNFTIFGGPAPLRDPMNAAALRKWRVNMLPNICYEYAALVQYWWRGRI